MSTLLETFASYMPAMLLRQFAHAPQLRTEPQAAQLPAAVLFADISGFTHLTKVLTQHGLKGEEQLTHILNAYFGQLIDLITAHGGEVVKFAGDGLLAVWLVPAANTPAAPTALAEATWRAAQCSLAIQAALHNYEAMEQIVLSLHIGLSAGTIYNVHLGGQAERWEFTLAGEPVAQAVAACEQAAAGQCVVAPMGWELIAAHCQGQPLPLNTGQLLLSVAPLPPQRLPPPVIAPAVRDLLQGYLPAAIRQRLEAGQIEWMAEFRRVTALFVALPTLDLHTSLPQSQTIVQAFQIIVDRFEGSINHMRADDKGVVFLVALGLPLLTHSDDPLRGVQAALAIQAVAQNLGLQIHIGLTTGRAFCGSVGNTQRREYTLLGDSVNVAARLMQQAFEKTQAIFCDAATYQATQSQIEFETFPPLTLKGQPGSVEVYQPLSTKTTPKLKTTALIGRITEQAQLTAGLTALQAGKSGVILVEGEAGIGKSQLVAAFQAQAKAAGVACLLGAGDAVERITAYYAWRAIFTTIFAPDNWPTEITARQAQVTQHLQTLLGNTPEALALTPLLNSVLPVSFPENAETQVLQGEGRASKTNNWLSQLLQKYSGGRPLVLILEDAQWLDSASWALARLASWDVHPLLLVLVTRSVAEPLPSEYRHFLNRPELRHIKLESLSPAETQQLVATRLGVQTLPEAVATFIWERSEGHPFFSEELAFALRDAGIIQVQAGACQVAPNINLNALSLPTTMQGIVAGRIDKLPPQEQLALKVASVIGRVFAFRVLQAVHPIQTDIEALPDYLNNLTNFDLTRLEAPPPETSYFFKHVITQQVAYDLMLLTQRQQLHRAVAEWYEQTQATDLTNHYSELAHHWQKAEVAEKAMHYLARAGEQAHLQGAHAEAIAFLTSALELETQLPKRATNLQRAQWLYRLGEAHYSLGHMPQSQAVMREALALLGLPLPASPQQLIGGLLRELLAQLRQRLWPSLPVLPTEQQVIWQLAAQINQDLTTIVALGGDQGLTLYTVFRAVNLAEAVGKPALHHQAQGHAIIASMLDLLGGQGWARHYVQLSHQALANVTTAGARAKILYSLGANAINHGQWAPAMAHLQEAQQRARQVGNIRLWEEVTIWHTSHQYFVGQLAAAGVAATELYQVALRQGDEQAQAWGRWLQARTQMRQGSINQAQLWAEEAVTVLASKADAQVHFSAMGVLLQAQVRLGNWPAAETLANTLLATLKKFQALVVYAGEGHGGLAYYHLLGAEKQAAASLLPAAQASVKRLKDFAHLFEIMAPMAWIYSGWYEQLAGHAPTAQQHWAKALSLAQQVQMPYEEALAHYHWGRFLPATDPDRQTHLKKALAIFERLGSTWDAAQVQTSLSL